MQLHFNENERALVGSVEQVVCNYLGAPNTDGISTATHCAYSEAMREELEAGGFLNVACEPEFGPVCAVLLIEEVAKSPYACEVGTSALIAPMVGNTELPGPVAVVREEDLARPIRYLPVARTLLVTSGDKVLALEVDQRMVARNAGMFAYPFGTFIERPDLGAAKVVGSSAKAEIYWQVALAAEGAGLMQAALDFTIEYVKNRRQFGRPIGSFQAIQHRLAASSQKARGATWLARRAAWSGTAQDAATAALYMQQAIRPVVYDCHQFNGAMGMTLEYPLHYWTYRLKALQGELGGASSQARRLAGHCWAA